jgi:peptidyl-prolyl cis-trans isomerase SurA
MVKRLLAAFGICMLAGLVQSCHKDETPGPDVWAVVNGHEIKRSEVEKLARNNAQTENQTPSQEEVLSIKLGVLDQLINNEILMELAQKQGLAATDGEVEDKFTEEKAPYTEDEFQRQMKDGGLSVDDFKQQIRQKLTIEKQIGRAHV